MATGTMHAYTMCPIKLWYYIFVVP